VNLPRLRVVLSFAVVLFVAAVLLVSTMRGTSTRPIQAHEGIQAGASTGGIPASVAVIPGLATAFVAALAIFANNQQERNRQEQERQLARDRQEHERGLKQMELENQRQKRLRDERLEAYIAFMAVCDRLHGGDHSQEARAELRKIVKVVELVSLSKEVQDSLQALTNHLIIRTGKGDTEKVSLQDESAYGVLHRKFTKAIQQDIGIIPTSIDPDADSG
jgi:hypothetical protein